MKDKLSVKERRFLEKYLEGKPLYECAQYAGSKGKDKTSLTVRGCQILGNLSVPMGEILNMNGVTDQALAEKVNEGLQSQKKYFGSWQGAIIESEEFPDVTNRLKAVEIAGRMKGVFIDKTELTGKDGGEITISYAPSKIGLKKTKQVNLDID